jgi:primase-polymerase (primpol)-like protein
MGYVSMVAYGAGANPQQVDAIYRTIKLFREKWDERPDDGTYGSKKIAKQLPQQTSYYQPHGRAALEAAQDDAEASHSVRIRAADVVKTLTTA